VLSVLRIYVSGPMSGKQDLNFPAFHQAAAALRAKGHKVTNPAELDAQDEGKALGWADYMRRDVIALMGCNAIAMLPGWQDSKGAQLEHHIAQTLGMAVLFLEA
jgi:hypothetical protein